MNKISFKYRSSNGLLNINSLSPSSNFFYRVQEPKELNKSAFGCEIAFFNINEQLIYHRSKVYAHELHNKDEIEQARHQMELGKVTETLNSSSIEVVKWSIQGNIAYFLEHYSWNFEKIYESVFLNLKEEYCYRINEVKNNFKIVDSLHLKDREFNEHDVLEKLKSMGLQQEGLIKDEMPIGNFFNLFSRNKWYP